MEEEPKPEHSSSVVSKPPVPRKSLSIAKAQNRSSVTPGERKGKLIRRKIGAKKGLIKDESQDNLNLQSEEMKEWDEFINKMTSKGKGSNRTRDNVIQDGTPDDDDDAGDTDSSDSEESVKQMILSKKNKKKKKAKKKKNGDVSSGGDKTPIAANVPSIQLSAGPTSGNSGGPPMTNKVIKLVNSPYSSSL